METELRATQTMENRRRIILFPLPFQGHITPMLQLANILHTQGFNITIIHTEYNAPNHSNYPHFTFISISDRFHEITNQSPPTLPEPGYFLSYLNRSCVDPFTNCLAGLLADESNKGSIACLVTDAAFYFTQAVADTLKLPRMVLRTGGPSSTVAYGTLSIFSQSNKDCSNQFTDLDYEAAVPEFPIMKVKDVMKMANNPKSYGEVLRNMIKQMKASSGIIWNTFEELEEPSLEIIRHDYFPVHSFTIGPLNKYFSASSSSLIEQDKTILSWLDTQAPNSVIYVSFGSATIITESEFQEIAHGLANTGLPFLWVVRSKAVSGSEWVESLPEKFMEKVGDRGQIVKWCPQQDVLAHSATGCFWTHCGWNSTLESISEGVPMVCSPRFTDQPINARYVSDVWKIGVLLEDGFERVGIQMAIKRVMMDEEGEEMRERISCLKEKVNMSLKEGGSSHQSLKSLVDYISSLPAGETILVDI